MKVNQRILRLQEIQNKISRSIETLRSTTSSAQSTSFHEEHPIRLTGLNLSAQAYLLSQIFEILQTKKERFPFFIPVICPDDETAEMLCSQTMNFHRIFFQTELLTQTFSTWEQSPFTSISPSLKTRFNRLAGLQQIVTSSLPQLIFTSLPGLTQATLPLEVFKNFSISMKINESIESREVLIQKLLKAGYLKQDPVEEMGTFSVRGEIIDIYPPSQSTEALPIRIELFDDVVEKIRKFDPTSQRTLPQPEFSIQEVFIPPAREILIHSDNAQRIREKIKSFADDQGIPRNIRDPILESIKQGTYPDHSEVWADFSYENPATLLDYLQSEFFIFWIDEFSCLQNWNQFLDQQKKLEEKLYEDFSRKALILPALEKTYLYNEKVKAILNKNSSFFLDKLELLNSTTTYQVELEPQNISANKDASQALDHLEEKLKNWIKEDFRVVIHLSTESQLQRTQFLLEQRKIKPKTQLPPELATVTLTTGEVSESFYWPTEKLIFLSESEFFGAHSLKQPKKKKASSKESSVKEWSGLQDLMDLEVGDFIVHIDHGIGKYLGLTRLGHQESWSDFLSIEYANHDKLYVPVYRLNVIQKYFGAGQSSELDRLGSPQFAKTKDKVKEAVRKLAIDLIQLYAQRKIQTGLRLPPPDPLYYEFEAKFPFDETSGQLKAIEDVMEDLESGKSMDRLVCGDVGYGKTEVAIRAAFRVVSEGKQVAVLVPTTLLAFQHEQSFKSRMNDYPIQIDSLSRFKTPKEQKKTIEALSQGKVDIIVGTHRLLSKDVQFKNLGLIIIDEEHRFGVEHKEKLKTLKVNTHILTLTATPIPRTLHMSLSGLKDISLINTPPVNRQPIRTYVSKFDETVIKNAIEFELNRGGQVFFLHNRVQSIYELARKIQTWIPEAKVSVAHGQMDEKTLEDTMLSFYHQKSNVLVCTTIIESGLDVPLANTILIDRADTLGLAQLYQIRGRVGRGEQKGYAYLLIPASGYLTEDGKKRLEIIQRFVELGSGFSIASHDLEIRGGGDLLGANQSGHIASVGFELYTELLEEAIQDLKTQESSTLTQQKAVKPKEPEIKIPFSAFLPDSYIPEIHQRLSLYRRFSLSDNEGELLKLEEEVQDRFGKLPPEAINLLWLIKLKILLKAWSIESINAGTEKISLVMSPQSPIDISKAIALAAGKPKKYQLHPDSKLVISSQAKSLKDLFFSIEEFLSLIRE